MSRAISMTVLVAACVLPAAYCAARNSTEYSESGHKSTVNVSSSDELNSALRDARPGETIILGPGLYAHLVISHLEFSSPVILTSSEATHPAILSGLQVVDSSGLKFEHLELTTVGSGDSYAGCRVSDSQNISFTHVDVHGDLSGKAGDQLHGLYITTSSNITVTGSLFHKLNAALVANRNDHVTVSDNVFQELSKGGVEMGGDSDVMISGNKFTNFETAPGVHGDAVQIYTMGTTKPSENVVVKGNLYYRGSGVAAQGIFLRDEVNTLPFYNVTIDDNAIIGAIWNGIDVTHAKGNVQLTNNTVASWAGWDVEAEKVTKFESWIRLGDLSTSTLIETGNRAQHYLGSTSKALPPPPGNTIIGPVTDNGAALLREWIKTHSRELEP